MRKIFTIFLLVSMMCVSICGCSSASARQETLLTIEEKTEVDALETAITATDANQTIEEPEEEAVRHTEEVDGFSDDMQFDNTMGVIDSDYYFSDNEGHIFAKITNDSKSQKIVHVEAGNGFMQAIFIPYGITYSDDATGVRNGGMGSTDSKA